MTRISVRCTRYFRSEAFILLLAIRGFCPYWRIIVSIQFQPSVAMSVSNDPQNFFQSTASLETLERRRKKLKNINGHPLTLPAKILTLCIESRQKSDHLPIIFTGESGGLARRVNLQVFKYCN